MLTEAEKKWLEERKSSLRYACHSCKFKGEGGCFYVPPIEREWCYLDHVNQDWADAAEFEARVSRIMALYLGAPPCGVGTCNNPNFLCPECRLKHARLKAEQEME